MFKLDPAHEKVNIFGSKLSQSIWRDKYRWQNEESIADTFTRVAVTMFPHAEGQQTTDPGNQIAAAMIQGLWLPGGRITASAGTAKRTTLMNCYVNATLDDSMEGILNGHSNVMLTLQQGGGIGTDFSPLRPAGAILRRTHTKASGPIPFMHMWNAGSRTIRSAGDRRGAMMGTICDTHPDLLTFINAKKVEDALTQFNVSILVSDALMEAVREDADWLLYHSCEPLERESQYEDYDFTDDNNVKQYVYAVYKARWLWDQITATTYEYSEPGVIFIDRINELNNLYYCEEISCTNPCGEQPLPPHGTCNLGHVNLARMVTSPFNNGQIDWNLLELVTKLGIRFLDNVIDITRYPLPEQEQEEKSKRRLGLGFTGLADALAEMGIRYGSPTATAMTSQITEAICLTSYWESVAIAKEKGAFPLFDKDKYLTGNSFASTLPSDLKDAIAEHGIRNSHLNTVAPVGTGSAFFGNPSSGCEPTFLHHVRRRMLKSTSKYTDEHEEHTEYGYGAALYRALHTHPGATGDVELPSYMVEASDLTVEDHIVMQAAAQRWVDSSISKTVNVRRDMPRDSFAKVYELAYSLGCKGCTTYRPNPLRGSVLSAPGETSATAIPKGLPRERREDLQGSTYKIKWPSLESALYLTINHDEHGPFEVFINTKDARNHDWQSALTMMITAQFRNGGDFGFVGRELQQVQSMHDTAWIQGKFHPSLPAYIGYKLEKHVNPEAEPKPADVLKLEIQLEGEQCPQCRQMTLIRKEGCKACPCGYSSC